MNGNEMRKFLNGDFFWCAVLLIILCTQNDGSHAAAYQPIGIPGSHTTSTSSYVTQTATPHCKSPTVDCTDEIQELFNNVTVSEVFFSKGAVPGGLYITRPLFVKRSNLDIVFEAGVTLLARRWYFNGTGSSLLSVSGVENVTLRCKEKEEVSATITIRRSPEEHSLSRAYNSRYTSTTTESNDERSPCSGDIPKLRMWRSDYNNSHWYPPAEWRMALNLLDVKNVLVQDLMMMESGGDGIYIGGTVSQNVTIRRIVSRNNYRQGMSIVSVNGLLVQDSIFEGTDGANPMSGVDFEPNYPFQQLRNILFERCVFRNNTGWNVKFEDFYINESTVPTYITMRNCTLSDMATTGGVRLKVNPLGGRGGCIRMSDIIIKDAAQEALRFIFVNGVRGPAVVFERFNISNVSYQNPSQSPIFVFQGASGVTMQAFIIADTAPRPAVYLGHVHAYYPPNVTVQGKVFTPFPSIACNVSNEPRLGDNVSLVCEKKKGHRTFR